MSLILALFLFCNNHNKQESTDFELILNFYNEVLDTIVGENLLINKPEMMLSFSSYWEENNHDNNTDSLFIEYFSKYKNFNWQNENLISRDSIDLIFKDGANIGWKIFREKYGYLCFIDIGIPYFSTDFKKAYVSINKNCGPLDGFGMDYVFVLKKDKWHLISAKETWES
jgi:hypothetical protein